MSVVYMRVQCSDINAEVFVDDVEGTELTIESLVTGALLEVFDSVQVENITLRPYQERNRGYKNQGSIDQGNL